MKVTASGASTNPIGRRAVAEALSKAAQGLRGRTASYGFLFVSPSIDIGHALQEARQAHPSTDFIASTTAGPALSYGLGQGATLVGACWGVFVWKEFKGAPPGTNGLLGAMFLFYLLGLGVLIASKF